jgi:SAM-dependent methyltransferase
MGQPGVAGFFDVLCGCSMGCAVRRINVAQGPYTHFAALYDWVMDGVKYDMWADYVVSLAERFGIAGKELLDLACGTGNTTYTMIERGYRVTGVDASEDMLGVARSKAARYAGAPVAFVRQDMRELVLGRVFDMITCLYDSVNYLMAEDDLVRAFKSVAGHLKPQGIFIFDVNTEYQLAKTGRTPPSLFEKGDEVALFWKDEWRPAEKIWRVHLNGFVKQGDAYRRFSEVHEERAYSIAQLEQALSLGGFSRTSIFDAYTFAPPRHDSMRLHFACRL